MRTMSKDKLQEKKKPRLEWHSVCIDFVVSLVPSIVSLAFCWLPTKFMFTGSGVGRDRRAMGRSPELAFAHTLHFEREATSRIGSIAHSHNNT